MSMKRTPDDNNSGPDPKPLMALSTAYWGSQTLFTGIRLGLFEQLSSGPRTVDSITAALGTNPRATRLFLKACVGLELIQEDSDGYRNSRLSQTYLVPGTDYYLGNSFRYCDNLFRTWAGLEDAITEGKPALKSETYLGGNPEKTKHFVYGMHNRALAIGKIVTQFVDLTGRTRLLDIGGGPGTFSSLFAKQYSGLRAQVFDLPDIIAIADEIIQSMGMSSQVTTIPGDYTETKFPAGNDVVLISGVFHRETGEDCQKLIRKATNALVNGGMLVIIDIFTDADNCSPLFSTLFGLNMLLTSENGGVHADTDVVSWMKECGFTDTTITPLPPPMPHRIIIGYKQDARGTEREG